MGVDIVMDVMEGMGVGWFFLNCWVFWCGELSGVCFCKVWGEV